MFFFSPLLLHKHLHMNTDGLQSFRASRTRTRYQNRKTWLFLLFYLLSKQGKGSSVVWAAHTSLRGGEATFYSKCIEMWMTLVSIRCSTEFVLCIAVLCARGRNETWSLSLVCSNIYKTPRRFRVTRFVWFGSPLKFDFWFFFFFFSLSYTQFPHESCLMKVDWKVQACVKRPKESSWKRLVCHEGFSYRTVTLFFF